MYVYELALELDRRSADLVDQAAAVGLPGLTPSADLKPDEVVELCTALGLARNGPGAPGGPGTWGPPQTAASALPGELPAPPRRRRLRRTPKTELPREDQPDPVAGAPGSR